MNNKLVTTAVGATILIIVLATVLMPVLDDSSSGLRTKSLESNEGLKYFDEFTSYTLGFDTATGTYTLNDETIEYPDYTMLVLSDAFSIYVPSTAEFYEAIVIDYSHKVEERVLSGEVTLNVVKGQYTLTTPTNTYTGTTQNNYCYSGDEGAYVENTVFYANSNTKVMIRIGDGFWFADNCSVLLNDLPAGSSTITIQKYASQTWSEDYTATLTWDAEANSDGTYSISSFLIDGSTPEVLTALAPVEYATYEDNSATSLVKVIPILIIVAALLGVISVAVSKR